MSSLTHFEPLTTPPEVRELAAFDIETSGAKAYFDLGAWTDGTIEYISDDPSDFIQSLFSRQNRHKHFYSHNLAYDYGVLLPYLTREYTALFVSGNLYHGKVSVDTQRYLNLHDSASMAGYLSIERLGDVLNFPKWSRPPAYAAGTVEPSVWHCDWHNTRWCHECYVMRDTQICLAYMDHLQQSINDLGGELKNTIAGCAMDLFRRRYLKRAYRRPKPYQNEFARRGYYGGRTENFVTGTVEGITYADFSSMYPSVMVDRQYPDPGYLKGPRIGESRKTIWNKEGFSEVTVRQPFTHVPLLPLRTEEKLYFPYGTFRGVYSHPELRRFEQSGGKILTIHQTLYSERACSPFDTYVQTLYDARLRYREAGDPRQLVVKLLLNSLYGKFGQRTDSGLSRLRTWDSVDHHEEVVGMESVVIAGHEYLRDTVYGDRIPSYVIVPWAAYVTAYGRIKLYDELVEHGDTLIYCDTDSVMTTGPVSTSRGLGGLDIEEEGATVTVRGPKFYQLHDSAGTVKHVVRGVPSPAKKAFFVQDTCTFTKSVGWLEASARNLKPSEWIETTRTYREPDPKRDFLPAPPGQRQYRRSHPRLASEVLRRQPQRQAS